MWPKPNEEEIKETVPFAIVQKRIGYLGIVNQSGESLYTKNYKSLITEIQMERCPTVTDWKN